MTNKIVLTDAFYYSVFGNHLNVDRIESIILLNKKFQWLGYVLLPLILILKWLLVTGIIYTGVFLFNQQISFANCFKIVMVAELVIILAAIVKLACFLIHPPGNFQDVQNFYPLSLTQILNLKQFPTYVIYPLQQFNLFEVAYWVMIVFGIKTFTQRSFGFCVKNSLTFRRLKNINTNSMSENMLAQAGSACYQQHPIAIMIV